MIRNVCFSLLLSLVLASNAFSQSIFELKGKSIIIPPTTNQYENCVYTEQVLNKYKFKSEYLYQESILGDKIDILDVVHIDKGKRKEAILLFVKHKGNNVVFYMPMRWNNTLNDLFQCFYTEINQEEAWFNIKYSTSPQNISLYHYNADLLDVICKKYQNKHIYFVKEPYTGMAYCGQLKLQQRYRFVGYMFGDDINFNPRKYRFNTPTFEQLFLVLKDPQDEVIRIPIKMDSLMSNHVNYNFLNLHHSNTTLTEFEHYVETEEEFLNNSKKQYDIQQIEYLRTKYVGQEVYVKSKEYVEKGYYQFKDITLSESYGKDIYLHYYALLESCENKRTYKFPIVADIEKRIVLAEVQRKKEAEEARKQAEKEAEYQAILEKEEREYKASLIKKYGKKNALLILENAVQIGFTKEMCVEAWGEPYDINRTVTRNGIHEQWVYDIGRYLYFDGNILTAIQD